MAALESSPTPFEASGSLNGIFAAVLTPFDRNLAPDLKRFVALARVLEGLGLGLVPFGTTGEGNSLSVAERLSMLDAMGKAGINMARVLPSVGCCALTDTVELSKRAVKLGCGGVLWQPPFYFKNVTDEGLYRSFCETIDKVGDAKLKVYLYHFPKHGLPLSHGLIERLLTKWPSTIVGLKDSSGNFGHMLSLRANFPQLDLFSGSEEFTLDLARQGGAGVICAHANVMGAAMEELWRNWRTEQAPDLQESLIAFRKCFEGLPVIAALKWLVSDAAQDPCWRITRPPLEDITPTQMVLLSQRLQSAGFSSIPE